MPSYKTNDPKGWCGNPSRGAALGRPLIAILDEHTNVRLYLRRTYLTDGYDKNGTYFGNGEPLYWVADKEGNVDFMVRGITREQAKERARVIYPNALFYR